VLLSGRIQGTKKRPRRDLTGAAFCGMLWATSAPSAPAWRRPSVGAVITAEGIFVWKGDSTAKRVLYRRDRRVRRALLKKISALSAFSAMSFCSELKGAIQSIPQKEQFVKRGRTGILLSVRRSSATLLLCPSAPLPLCSLCLAPCSLRLATCSLLQFLHHLLHTPRIRMQIAGRGGETGVLQHHLQRRQVTPACKKRAASVCYFAVPTAGIRSRTWAPTPDARRDAGQRRQCRPGV